MPEPCHQEWSSLFIFISCGGKECQGIHPNRRINFDSMSDICHKSFNLGVDCITQMLLAINWYFYWISYILLNKIKKCIVENNLLQSVSLVTNYNFFLILGFCYSHHSILAGFHIWENMLTVSKSPRLPILIPQFVKSTLQQHFHHTCWLTAYNALNLFIFQCCVKTSCEHVAFFTVTDTATICCKGFSYYYVLHSWTEHLQKKSRCHNWIMEV